jgi:hypothetical protein
MTETSETITIAPVTFTVDLSTTGRRRDFTGALDAVKTVVPAGRSYDPAAEVWTVEASNETRFAPLASAAHCGATVTDESGQCWTGEQLQQISWLLTRFGHLIRVAS